MRFPFPPHHTLFFLFFFEPLQDLINYDDLLTWLCHFEYAEDVALFWKHVRKHMRPP